MESDQLTDLPQGPRQGPGNTEQKQSFIEQPQQPQPQQQQPLQQLHSEQDSRLEQAPARPGTGEAETGSEPEQPGSSSSVPWPSALTSRLQDHLKLFFSMHHKLFDLVAFYVVMFALNGQITSLPTRLEWIGFCVQSIVALRRAFQTSIKHGLGLTSFLGMLDLLVGQLFLHQDRLGFLPTIANILVYFYVINLTRGLVFGDSVSCLLWFLFGLVDIYRKDISTASTLDLTPYKVIPVHTVGFGLYILMSELVDVMLHSAEPDQIQGRYLNYVGAQKEGPVSFRSTNRRATNRSTDDSNLRFELCITEITPFTVSFCLNALSESPPPEQPTGQDLAPKDNNTSSLPPSSSPSSALTDDNATGSRISNETIDLSTIKVGSIANSFSNSSTRPSSQTTASTPTPRIISTSDIVIHVNYIPWTQVQYHFPDDQSFTLFGLTPSTDYEIEMKVHRFSSFIARVGTRAAPPGMPIPTMPGFGKPVKPVDPAPKTSKNRKSKRNQKAQRENNDRTASGTGNGSGGSGGDGVSTDLSTSILTPSDKPTAPVVEQKSANQLLLEKLQASIQASIDTAVATRATIKKLKRDQSKTEAALRQELEGIGRGQAKAALQDQKRRQKLSFLQESIKQTNAYTITMQEELLELKDSTNMSQKSLEDMMNVIRTLEQDVQTAQSTLKAETAPLKAEYQRLQSEMKKLDMDRQNWVTQTNQLQENEVTPLQVRLQRLEQQQSVWKVAAAANKDKDRAATLKMAALEEDVQRKNIKIQKYNSTILELKNANILLKEAVEKEMEVWEGLEREFEQDKNQAEEEEGDSLPSLTFSQAQLSSSSLLLPSSLSSTIAGSTSMLPSPLHHSNHHHHHLRPLEKSIEPIYSDSFWFNPSSSSTSSSSVSGVNGTGSSAMNGVGADLWQTRVVSKPLSRTTRLLSEESLHRASISQSETTTTTTSEHHVAKKYIESLSPLCFSLSVLKKKTKPCMPNHQG
ncbi:hypothetical protein FBU30_000580 [Linnemannia zychae]|nr:hypothetical protein FBU30_000580 [Linnemannia zychae]